MIKKKIRIFEGFAGYGGGSFGLKRLKENMPDVEFEVVGSGKKDLFATRIYRGKINPTKYEIGARIKKDGIMLLLPKHSSIVSL